MPASLNRQAFFDAVRKAPFSGGLTKSQVAGITVILDACPAMLGLAALAYALATVFHETARTMQPIEEYGRGKGKSYGPTGFWGRGFVQLTWEANYLKAGKELGYDLVGNPALAMRPDIAAAILFRGMVEGWFTSKKLGDYFTSAKSDPVGARRIINGTDKAALIAGYHASFVAALQAAGYSVVPASAAPPLSSVGDTQAGFSLPKADPMNTKPAPTGGLSSAPSPAPAEPGFWSRVHTFLSRKAA